MTRSSSFRWLAGMALVSLAGWALHLVPVLKEPTLCYQLDSASYLECARSISAGKGFLARRYDGLGSRIWEPMKNRPPGYPLLVALVSILGVPVSAAGVAVSVFCSAIFIFLLAWLSLRLFDPPVAFSVVLAMVSMPSFLRVSTWYMSDAAYLAFSMGSLVCLLIWLNRPERSSAWLAAAGLLGGFSYAVRFIGIALWVASALSLALFSVLFRRSDAIKILGTWGMGVLVTGAPFAIHQLLLFKSVAPYAAAPVPLQPSAWNDAVSAMVLFGREFTTWAFVEPRGWIRHSIAAALLIGAVLFGLWRWRRSSGRAGEFLRTHFLQVLLGIYFTVYMTLIVFARTSPFPNAIPINRRLVVPVNWILWAGCAAFGLAVFRNFFPRGKKPQAAVCAILLAAAFFQAKSYADEVNRMRQGLSHRWAGERVARSLEGVVAKDQIVLATRAFMLRFHGDINARQLPIRRWSEMEWVYSWKAIQEAAEKGLLWGIVIDDVTGARKGEYGALAQRLAEKPDDFPEFERIPVDSALVFRCGRTKGKDRAV